MADQIEKEVPINELTPVQFSENGFVLMTDEKGVTGNATGSSFVSQVQQKVEQSGAISEALQQMQNLKSDVEGIAAGNLPPVGTFNATSGLASVAATPDLAAYTFTPTAVSDKPKGFSLAVSVGGVSVITGSSITMAIGGTIRSNGVGVPWIYTPPSDIALKKTQVLDNELDILAKETTGNIRQQLAAPLTYLRYAGDGSARPTLGNMVTVNNLDRSIALTGWTDETNFDNITEITTGIPSSGKKGISIEMIPSTLHTTDPMFGAGFVAGSEHVLLLWRSTGQVAWYKAGTNQNTQLLAPDTSRDYVTGDKIRMDITFGVSSASIALFINDLAVGTTSAAFVPTGNIIMGMRGSMSGTFALSTLADGQIAKVSADVTARVNALLQGSQNMIPQAFTSDSSYGNSTGAIISATGWKRTTNLIAVLPNTTYTIQGANTDFIGNEYNASTASSGSRVRTIAPVVSGTVYTVVTFTTSNTTTYVGINVLSVGRTDNSSVAMMQLGSVAGPFEDYVKNYIKGPDIRGGIPGYSTTLQQQSYTDAKIGQYTRASVNLIPNLFTVNSQYSQGTGAISSSSGNAYRTTNLIPVLPNTTYTLLGFQTIFLGNEYNSSTASSGTRVQVITPSVTGKTFTYYVFTTSNTTTHVGLNVTSASGVDARATAMMVQGVVPNGTAYETYGATYISGAQLRGVIDGTVTKAEYKPQYPAIFYTYEPAGYSDPQTGSTLNTGQFYVYSKYVGQSNYYARYRVANLVNTTIRANLWKITGCDLYSYDGTSMTSLGINILTTAENEFVFQAAAKSDFTGGYHGDEIATDVSFFIDSVKLTDLVTTVSLTEAAQFWYIQKSNMYDTDNPVDVIKAVHHKHTRFYDGGFTTKNRVIWSAIVNINICYFGLATVSRDQAEVAYTENYDYATLTGLVPPGDVERFHTIGAREVDYYNGTTKLGAKVTSRVTKALKAAGTDNTLAYDSGCDLFVWDVSYYAKYYRRIQSKMTDVGEIWEGEMTFMPYKRRV